MENKQKKLKKGWKNSCHCTGGSIYGLGVIGSAIYYISNANGFWAGVLGLLKSLIWPSFLVYDALKFLGE